MALIAWYHFDESNMDAPTVAVDSSGNGYNGVYLGPTAGEGSNAVVAGVSGNAMQVNVPATYPDPHDLFGHAGMKVQAVHDFSFYNNDPFMVNFQLNLGSTDAVQTRAIVGAYDASIPPGDYKTWGFWIAGGETKLRFYRGDFCFTAGCARDEAVSPSLTPGTWYDILATYDGTDMKLYVDSTLEATTAGTVTTMDNAASSLSVGAGVPLGVIFGQKTFRYPPNGTEIDELKIYDAVAFADSATVAFYGGEAI